MAGVDGVPKYQVWADGILWGLYLLREHADEVVERLRRKGKTVELRIGYRV